jgi:hypothetical protein
VLFVPRGSSLRSMVVLGVRERSLYRLKGQGAGSLRGGTDSEGAQIQREFDLRGSQWA